MKKLLLEQELKISKQERRAFMESLRSFQQFKEQIYRSGTLKEITNQIGQIINTAEAVALQETSDGWFDNVTVKRDGKRLKESYKVFEKTAKEMAVLQQRLEACYEDIASGLSRYYEI